MRPQQIESHYAEAPPFFRARCNRCSWSPKVNYDTKDAAANANARHRDMYPRCRR